MTRALCFRVVVHSLALVTGYFLLIRNVADYDLWGVLSFGALVDQVGFPWFDVFSYTAPQAEWIYHEWGSGVLFYRILTDWGDGALFLVKVGLFVASLLIAASLHRTATEGSESPLADGVFFLMGLPGCYLLLNSYMATVRCHAFSVLGYLVFLLILEGYRRNPSSRAPWLLPPLTAIWINLHGGFALGFFALGAYLFWFSLERRKPQATELAVITLFCLAATLLNPYGWRFLPKIVEAWAMSRAPIGEWGDVFGNGPVYAWTYAALAASTVSAAAVNARQDRKLPVHLVLLGATAIQGFLHVKLVPFFVFTVLSFGVPDILRLVQHYRVPQRVGDFAGLLLPAGVGTASAVLIVLQLATTEDVLRPRAPGWNAAVSRPEDPNHYPLGAAKFLAERPEQVRVWCPLRWGEFVSWTLYPNVRVSMDGRYETLYPGAVRDDHLRFWGPERDLAAADKYKTTHILAPRGDADLLARLDESDWARVYEDPIAVLYGRRAPIAMPAARVNDGARVGEMIGDLSRFAAPTPD